MGSHDGAPRSYPAAKIIRVKCVIISATWYRSATAVKCEPEGAPLIARTAARLSEIGPEDWGRLAGNDDPFVSYEFLDALEESGSCCAETGWLPQHLVLEDSAGAILGAMPLYLKNHSHGEYVFDHGWADAYERAGGRYYPKLQASVPFTPVTGRRLLVPPGADEDRVRGALVGAAIQVAKKLGVATMHVTFPTESEWLLMGTAGFLRRTGEQFHWRNQGYETFDDFLATLTSRKRKMIRKERARAFAADITIEAFTGGTLRPEHWDAFYRFYIDTGSRKWGRPYLNREFFEIIHQTMADRIALILCSRDGRYIAGALNFIGADTLFGRNWGCIEHHDFLHFEACYYQAIDFAIAHRLEWVEAGAQGPHKIQRGYLPRLTYSAHWIADPNFRTAVADYLDHERDQVDHEIESIERSFTPYRKDS